MGRQFLVNRPVQASKDKKYASGYEGELPELTNTDETKLLEMGVLTSLGDETSASTANMSEEERANAIVAAVKLSVDADPERKTPPTIADIKAITEFDVTGAEVKAAFKAVTQAKQK
jgi:hypothetical protein